MLHPLRRAAVTLGALAVACSPQAKPSSGRAALPRPDSARPYWLITRRALAMIADEPGVREVLDTPRTFVIVPKKGTPPRGWSVTVVASFTSYATLHSALAHKDLPRGTAALLYDPERWKFTPEGEQREPGRFIERAAADAHAAGMPLIVSPALNLAQVIAPGPEPVATRFLTSGVLGSAARSADIVDIQAQRSIASPDAYASLVKEGAAEARRARPEALVLAGLSTNPDGPVVTIEQLQAAVRNTRSLVDGYWINIPIKGPYCPDCNPARPDLAVELLRSSFSARQAP